MTYVFGREVTVKLPEPTREDARTAYWHVDGVGGVKIHKKDNAIFIHYSGVIIPEGHMAMALAYLAAADYAELGGEDAGRDL